MMMMSFICSCRNNKKGRLCERMSERKRGAREGACIGGATTPQPSIEVDPQGRRFGRRESDFALQILVEGRAAKPE